MSHEHEKLFQLSDPPPVDPDGLEFDYAAISGLMDACMASCKDCQAQLIEQISAEPVNTFRLMELALAMVVDRITFIPASMYTEGAPGLTSTPFRRAVKFSHDLPDGEDRRKKVLTYITGVTQQDRRAIVEDSTDISVGMLNTL